MADDYGFQRWLEGRTRLLALAEREGLTPDTNTIPDFTDRYNTKLSPKQEAAFQDWIKTTGREGDLRDYDLRGAYADMMSGKVTPDARGHLPDTYKKPNHPTFSNQSQYSGQDGFVGGIWSELPNGKFVFTPGNNSMWSKEDLNRYFLSREPNNLLIDNRTGNYYNDDIGDRTVNLGNTGNGFVSNPVLNDRYTTLPLHATGSRG